MFRRLTCVLALLALSGAASLAYAKTSYVFRINGSDTLESWNTVDKTWKTIASPLAGPSTGFKWVAYDERNPAAICFIYGFTQHVAQDYRGIALQCTTDAGRNWSVLLGRFGFSGLDPTSPIFTGMEYGQYIRRLQLTGSNRLTLTTTDNDFFITLTPAADSGQIGSLTLQKQAKQQVCTSTPLADACIHATMTGRPRVWYDPQNPGQGLTLTEANGFFWAYFTAYDNNGNAAWWMLDWPGYTGTSGPFVWDGGSLELVGGGRVARLDRFTGPAWGSNWNSGLVTAVEAGSGMLSIQGPNQIRVKLGLGQYPDPLVHSYDPVNELRQLTLVPFDAPSVITEMPDCSTVPAGHICADTYLNGWSRVWYDPTQPGQGLTLTAVNGAFWGYYTAYDANGAPSWWLFTSSGPLAGSKQFNVDLLAYTGPRIATSWDTSKLRSNVAGNAQLILQNSSLITMDVQIGGKTRSLRLVPFDKP